MREEVSQPGPPSPLLASGLGQKLGRAEQLDWDWASEISWPSLGILRPFLGTLSWCLAQVLGKDECVRQVEVGETSHVACWGMGGLGGAVTTLPSPQPCPQEDGAGPMAWLTLQGRDRGPPGKRCTELTSVRNSGYWEEWRKRNPQI